MFHTPAHKNVSNPAGQVYPNDKPEPDFFDELNLFEELDDDELVVDVAGLLRSNREAAESAE